MMNINKVKDLKKTLLVSAVCFAISSSVVYAAIEEIDGGVPEEPKLMAKQKKPEVNIKDKPTLEKIICDDPYFKSQMRNIITYPDFDATYKEQVNGCVQLWNPLILVSEQKDVKEIYLKNFHRGLRGSFEVTGNPDREIELTRRINAVFETIYPPIPNDGEGRKQYFLNNDMSFLSRPLIESCYKGAKRIMGLSNNGDHLVIFGNTPYFVGRALESFISKDEANENYRKLIYFPFSGAPNSGRDCYLDADKVDHERLSHLKERMEKNGLSSNNSALQGKSLYFIDAIASGSGPHFVTEEIIRDFKKAQLELPNINMINIAEMDIEREDKERNRWIAKTRAMDGEQTKLYLPSISTPHYIIDAYVVHVPGHGLMDNLPSDHWRVFPEYRAHYWYSDFDYMLRWEENAPPHIRVLWEYFDTNIVNLKSQEKNIVATNETVKVHEKVVKDKKAIPIIIN